MIIAPLKLMTGKLTSGMNGANFGSDSNMRDDVHNDLDDKKTKQNDPVWHGIIFPGHHHISIIH